jgi:hypothetical protein
MLLGSKTKMQVKVLEFSPIVGLWPFRKMLVLQKEDKYWLGCGDKKRPYSLLVGK